MKTIKQLADEIGVSKQAIFYRMKRPPLSNTLQSLTTKVDGILMVSFDGEALIKQAFDADIAKGIGAKEPSKENTSFDGEILRILQHNLTVLQRQLEIKDKQLEVKDRQIFDLNDALKAAQTLHGMTTPRQKFLATDDSDRATERSFFSRIFNRSKKRTD